MFLCITKGLSLSVSGPHRCAISARLQQQPLLHHLLHPFISCSPSAAQRDAPVSSAPFPAECQTAETVQPYRYQPKTYDYFFLLISNNNCLHFAFLFFNKTKQKIISNYISITIWVKSWILYIYHYCFFFFFWWIGLKLLHLCHFKFFGGFEIILIVVWSPVSMIWEWAWFENWERLENLKIIVHMTS